MHRRGGRTSGQVVVGGVGHACMCALRMHACGHCCIGPVTAWRVCNVLYYCCWLHAGPCTPCGAPGSAHQHWCAMVSHCLPLLLLPTAGLLARSVSCRGADADASSPEAAWRPFSSADRPNRPSDDDPVPYPNQVDNQITLHDDAASMMHHVSRARCVRGPAVPARRRCDCLGSQCSRHRMSVHAPR